MDTRRCCGCDPIRGAATIPVVAVTAFAMKDDIERADEAGFDGYIAKPISVRALPGQLAPFLPDGARA